MYLRGSNSAGLVTNTSRIFRRHRQAQVGVDVNFAHAVFADGHVDLIFGHALGVGHLAAVLVDQIDELLRHAAAAVHDQRQAGAGFHDLFNAVEGQLGLMLELERAVARADGDGKAVALGFGPEILRLNRIGQKLFEIFFVFLGVQANNIFFNPAEHAQLGLDNHAGLVCMLGGFLW